MGEVLTRRYGPFRGYKSAVPRHLAGNEYLTGPGDGTIKSTEFLLNPAVRSVRRRTGSEILGSANGLLETVVADASAKARRIFQMTSRSISSGYPTWATLFADEAKKHAWVYWRDSNNAVDMNLGENFGATHYPTGGGVEINYKYKPIPYVHNGVGMTRFAYEQNRRYFGQGSRDLVQIGDTLFAPGYLGTPVRWNLRYNSQAGAGTEAERVSQTGLPMPMHPGRAITADLPGASATGSWQEYDQFFLSYAFVSKTGEVSVPFTPSATTLAAPAGEYMNNYGLVTVPSDGSANHFRTYLRIKSIPRGPEEDTVSRLVLRSYKVDSSVAGMAPNRYKLFIAAVIPNNTQTQFDLYDGNDSSLVDDPAFIRFDRKLPYPARYGGTVDQRHITAYLNPPNPCAIFIAPTGVTSSRDLNNPDTHPFATELFYRVVAGAVELRTDIGGVTTTTSIATGAGVSIGSIIDSINATTEAGGGEQWAAQPAPGTDVLASSDKLALTIMTISCTNVGPSATLTTAASFTDVAVGMRIVHGNVTPGTYVKSVESNTSLTMSAAATGAFGPANVDFHVDTGDDGIVANGSKGNIRVHGNSFYSVIPFNRAYLDSFDPLPRDCEFTAGGPADPPFAGNSFITGNKRTVPIEAGISMGVASLLNGGLSFYSRAVGRFTNIRGGKTGLDSDYRNEIWLWDEGCISPYSIVRGHGWIGWLSRMGYMVSDGQTRVCISPDIFDPGPTTKVGDLAYAISRCTDAAESDSDDFPFHATIDGGRIVISFQLNSGGTCCQMVYDFSPGIENAGLAQVLGPDGTPWGWSTLLQYRWRGTGNSHAAALGSVRQQGAQYLIMADDTNDKTTCGLLARIENGAHTEGGQQIQSYGYTATDLCDTLLKKCLIDLRCQYRLDGASELLTTYRTLGRITAHNRTLGTSGANPFRILPVPAPIGARSPAQVFEHVLQGLAGTWVEYFMLEADVEVMEPWTPGGEG